MSQCLQKQVERYGIEIFDNQEATKLLTTGSGDSKKIIGIAAVDKTKADKKNYALNLFLCENLVLAAGGPGALYETSVYPLGQIGIHGLAFEAGLTGENITESQFGLASTKFRWNVSGTYMQVIPRIFSTDADGKDEQEFLTPFFPAMSKMATDIFLKGYQWPFDPQKIENLQSSLVDIIVFNETQKGRHVFMDFLKNPIGSESMKEFTLEDLEDEALNYLKATGALQATPIERLAHMNPLAIDIYKENGIDLYKEPLEIAVCAQHNNGGFAVNRWWQSNIPGTFIIGEMAGSHGVKRPGGSALNAGQSGGLRAAEYIVNVCGSDLSDYTSENAAIEQQLNDCVAKLEKIFTSAGSKTADEAIQEIQHRMTTSGGHIREIKDAKKALAEAVALYKDLKDNGVKLTDPKDLAASVQAGHLALASAGYLKGIIALLEQGSGSRGSHLVLSEDGNEIHPDVIDKSTGKPLRYKPENQQLRNSILRVQFDPASPDLFKTENVPVRPVPKDRKAFEPAWQDYREGKIYG
jgi:succinate dehydrogenase/fumarate reductase flavoprotein subunit